jgi:hypothetical protein
VVVAFVAALRAGMPRAEAGLALVQALGAIADDLMARHGEAGEAAWSAALDTAHAVLVQERAQRSA